MSLLVLGINHNTAPLAVREKVAFSPDQTAEALMQLCAAEGFDEAVILSTCNRTEVVVVSEAQDAGQRMLGWLAAYHHLPLTDLSDCHYLHRDAGALRHLIQVASGLNSMVLGEPQIFGQMKSAYAVAHEAGTVSATLAQVMQHTFTVAKKVRTDTAIGENPVSVAFAAVNLATRIFEDLSETRALLIGAGETIELVAQHLRRAGIRDMVVANRTLERASALAREYDAEAVMLSDIPAQLERSDIVISSTASQLPILGKGAVEKALRARKHKPIFMVDIAVPRDIEEQVGELADVYLYSVDDLKDVIDRNIQGREREARKADAIIDQGVSEFNRRLRSQGAIDTLRAYRSRAESLRDDELNKALRQLENGVRPAEALSNLARTLTNKLIHTPSIQMKKASAEGRMEVIEWTRELLGLDEPAFEQQDSGCRDQDAATGMSGDEQEGLSNDDSGSDLKGVNE